MPLRTRIRGALTRRAGRTGRVGECHSGHSRDSGANTQSHGQRTHAAHVARWGGVQHSGCPDLDLAHPHLVGGRPAMPPSSGLGTGTVLDFARRAHIRLPLWVNKFQHGSGPIMHTPTSDVWILRDTKLCAASKPNTRRKPVSCSSRGGTVTANTPMPPKGGGTQTVTPHRGRPGLDVSDVARPKKAPHVEVRNVPTYMVCNVPRYM